MNGDGPDRKSKKEPSASMKIYNKAYI